MKLAATHELSLVESTFVRPLPVLTENDEAAPRWSFDGPCWS